MQIQSIIVCKASSVKETTTKREREEKEEERTYIYIRCA